MRMAGRPASIKSEQSSIIHLIISFQPKPVYLLSNFYVKILNLIAGAVVLHLVFAILHCLGHTSGI
jgi:hypothetical protein